MKKLFYYMVGITVVVAISLASAEVYAGWQLYDNFNSGIIDPARWNIDDSCATITPVSGAVRFVHHSGHPEDSSWLIFKQSPETIKAIRVTMMMRSCTGDVRGRIGGRIGDVGADYVWTQLSVQPGLDRIFGELSVLEEGTNEWLYTLYWGELEYPLEIPGKRFTIATSFFDPQNVSYYVGGLGKHTVKVFKSVSPPVTTFKGIGTRSTNGDGPCEVFFDDVYVLR